jgi:hypothetical protein
MLNVEGEDAYQFRRAVALARLRGPRGYIGIKLPVPAAAGTF